MKIKRFISIILLIVIISTLFPLEQLNAQDISPAQFNAILDSLSMPYSIGPGKDANLFTYNNYGQLIVYGSPFGEPGRKSDVTKRVEYRYLGYTRYGQPYTNSYYPADPGSDNTTPPYWEFLDLDASNTWNESDFDTNVKAFMQNTQLKYDGTAYSNLKVGSTAQPNKKRLINGYLVGVNRAKPMDRASFKNGFSIYTKFENTNNAVRYATLYGPSMGENGQIDLLCSIATPANTYYIHAGEKSVTVPVTVTATAKLLNTYAKAEHIKTIDVEYKGFRSPKSAALSAGMTINDIYTRAIYPTGTYTIPLDGTGTMKSTLSEDDVYVRKAQKTITLIVEPEGPDPSATATISAEEYKKFTGNDIPVTVTMTGKINNITDVSKISKVIFHMGMLPKGADEQYIPLERPASLSTITVTRTFNVPKARLDGVNEYKQVFYGRVQYVLTDGTSVWFTLINNDPLTDSTIIYKEPPPPEPKPNKIPPVAILDGDDTVVIGNDAFFSATRSYDPDGTVEEYYWTVRGGPVVAPIEDGKKTGRLIFKQLGEYTVGVEIYDNDGLVDYTERKITVTPPVPMPVMRQYGVLKENRKIIVDASDSYSPPGFPIDQSKTTWTITPVSGNIEVEDIKYSGSLTGVRKEFIVKGSGKIKVSLTVVNSANMPGTTEQIFEVSPDKPPVADFTVVKEQLRSPNNGNRTQLVLYDKSHSDDGDYINKRKWTYAYDSNNNGLFTDETWQVIDDGNNPKPELYVYDVGKYAFELEVEEAFGQPTIPEFIIPADFLKANTLSKPAAEKILEVVNLAPVADISANKIKNIDIAVVTDYQGSKFTELQTKLNQYVADSFYNHLNVKVNLVNGSKYLGRYMPDDAGQFYLVPNETTPKYKVANWNGLEEWNDNTYHVVHTTQHQYTNFSTETYETFPSPIKKSIRYGEATIWWLENGDVYFLGTNSYNNYGWWSMSSIYALRPIKILSGVKQFVGGDDKYFMLTNSGDVYTVGRTYTMTYYAQQAFVNMFNHITAWSSIIPYQRDNDGYHPYNQYDAATLSGYYSAVKLNGVSNVNYIWSSGTAFVFRKTDGKWYGLGRGLNAFGLSTGFENVPPANIGTYNGSYYKHYLKGIDDQFYCDNVNSITEIKNLSNLDAALGGIEKVAPNTVYAKNGDVYYIKETPLTLYGYEDFNSAADVPQDGRVYTGGDYWGKYRVLYPFQIVRSTFTYNKIGTWMKERTQYNVYGYEYAPTVAQIMATGVPIDPYLDRLEKPMTGVREMYNRHSATIDVLQPTSYLSKSNRIIYSGITDYRAVAYIEDYTFSHMVWDDSLYYDRGDDKDPWNGGYRFYYNYTVRPIVIPMELTGQAGRKTYGVKIEDLPTVSFRPDAEKYVLYLGENDSFKKVSKDILDFIVNNNLTARVSAKSDYLDESVDTTKEINLRQFANATPRGKIYDIYQIDKMLQDITDENVEAVTGGNKLYVLVNEDIVEYLKYYYDYENDIRWAERFKYVHDANYFENSLGLAPYSGQWLSDLKYKFDKVGKYDLTYQAQDNPKNNPLFTNYWLWSKGENQLEIYVHRRPIASFLAWGSLVNSTTKSLNVTNYAYDLDHQSQASKGIVTTEYKWRFVNDATWRDGYPTTVTQGNPIYIWQRVQDQEGAWSYPVMKLIDFESLKNPPVAQFTIAKNPINIDELLKLKDTSYAREGTLIRWHWIVVKTDTGAIVQNAQFTNRNAGTGSLAGFDANVRTNYSALGAGNYRVYLRVKDSNNTWSDVGTDSTYDLNYFYSQSFTVISPPVAQFTIAKNPIKEDELLKLRDTSYARTGILTNWHWIVVKLDTGATVQNARFANSNNGSGALAGYDANVITNYESLGPGTYRIFLRVKDSNNTWSDGGTDAGYDINSFYRQDLVVQEGNKLTNFRVSIIRDVQLESYYKNATLGTFPDKPIFVNGMGIDGTNFGIGSLTKGYLFEFEIDSQYFNGDTDTVEIVPHFYTADLFSRDAAERELYWEDSKHQLWKAGQGGHSAWNKIVLTKDNRTINDATRATWRGNYLIPSTSWAVPMGTTATNAKTTKLNRDIVVNFSIRGYKAGTMKYDYTAIQWPIERTVTKSPYLVGDVIKYSYQKGALDDIKVKNNR